MLDEVDFIFLISLLTIDETDNADYFLYKFNISKKDQKRIKDIDNFYKIYKKLNEKNLNRVFYFQGKEAVIDILNFKLFKSKKIDNEIVDLKNLYKDRKIPTMPVKADILMEKYKIPKGKILGDKLKLIEDEWVSNNFQISEKRIEILANS